MNAIRKDILILGAGVTGLGASWRLLEKEEVGCNRNWAILERASRLGGNALSVIDDLGFTWDIGSHVIYSHYDYFNGVLSAVMGDDEWQFNERAGWIWMFEQFIPYPIQRNIRHFPQKILSPCLQELAEISQAPQADKICQNFEEWLRINFGKTLFNEFFAPFNFKMWARPTNMLSSAWVQLRSGSKNGNTPKIDLEKLLQTIKHNCDDPGWSIRDKFPYPKRGGFGTIAKRIGEKVPPHRLLLGRSIKTIKTSEKLVELDTGETIQYATLISTLPLPRLLTIISDLPQLKQLGQRLQFSGAHIVGVAYEGPLPQHLENKFWLYFPQLDLPFFRVSIISNYSRYNVPDPSRYWSLICEISSSEFKPINKDTLIGEVISGLYRSIVPKTSKVLKTWCKSLDIGYPPPFLGRDQLLSEIQTCLSDRDIFSRGRLGGMKYESSNTDYAFMQGVEVIDYITEGKAELSYFSPELVS